MAWDQRAGISGKRRTVSGRSCSRHSGSTVILSTTLTVSALSVGSTAVGATLVSSRGTGGPVMQETLTRFRKYRTPPPLHHHPYESEYPSDEQFLSQPASAFEEITVDSDDSQGEYYSSDAFLSSFSSSYEESEEPDRYSSLIAGSLSERDEPRSTYEHAARRYYEPPSKYNYYNKRDSNSSRLVMTAVAATAILKATATAAVVIAALTPLARALSSHWPYFVAGGICAAVSHTAAVPLDVIKTRMQCAQPGEYRSTWDAFVRICRSEGAQVLFCGAGATLVGYSMQGCLKFGFFEFLKPFFSNLFFGGDSGAPETPILGSLVAASVAAEVVGSSALTPLEAARIRMVADCDYAPGLRSGISRMISEEGLGALTRGLPAVLAKQIPYTVTKLVTFDVLVRLASRAAICNSGRSSGFGQQSGRGGGGGGGGVAVTLCCAVAAGILSSLASQPGDSLLSTLHSEGRQRGDENSEVEVEVPRESVARAMARIAREAGFFGLFRGTTARMMHVTSIVTVQLLIYQTVKTMVGITS